MKTALDPRHLHRIALMNALFAYDFSHQQDEGTNIPQPLLEKLPEIDAKIVNCAPAWPLDQINKVDLAILRISVYELLSGETPQKVVIDEAIELAKEFGAEHSPQFVNGVLATMIENKKEM
ncbi:MAG: transcription antitermination factor NusB [Candidatus Pacebacteria bacterium]|nr:transcription antitermination factor NusB [Candidatus Paceibacterota bacterium]